jgi:hypothetical protein
MTLCKIWGFHGGDYEDRIYEQRHRVAFTRIVVRLLVLLTLFLAHLFFEYWWLRRYVPPKLRFLQESCDVTSQKAAFFFSHVIVCEQFACYSMDTLQLDPRQTASVLDRTTLSADSPIVGRVGPTALSADSPIVGSVGHAALSADSPRVGRTIATAICFRSLITKFSASAFEKQYVLGWSAINLQRKAICC